MLDGGNFGEFITVCGLSRGELQRRNFQDFEGTGGPEVPGLSTGNGYIFQKHRRFDPILGGIA